MAKALLVLVGSIGVLGFWCSESLAQTTSLELTRLKPADAEMRRLILDGHARSVSFRQLIDEIQRSNAIVVVQFGLCANGRIRSCVSNVDGNLARRHIRIRVNTRTTDDRLIATIAHELQHAVEILRDPDVNDAASTLQLYRRIGTRDCQTGNTENCETEAAVLVEARVNEELEASR